MNYRASVTSSVVRFIRRFIRIPRLPFYRYPITRRGFKRFYKLVATLTGRDTSYPEARFSSGQEKILGELEETGFLVANPHDYSIQFQETLEKAMSAASSLIDDDIQNLVGGKKYLLNLDLTKAPKTEVQIMYNFFCRPEIESLASAYLGEKALMVELKILISPAVALPHHDGSQLWHSDFDDVSNLKLFVFLEDVTEDSGPLEVLSKSLSGRLMKDWGYLWGKRGVSHNDAIVPSEHQHKSVSLVGRAGSIAFVDSVQCLHRGSRNPKRTRKILYATFNTRSSFRFPPHHWILGKKFAGSRASPLLMLDPDKKFLTDLAINS